MTLTSRRVDLVVSNSTEILSQLRWPGFRHLALRKRVADSAAGVIRMLAEAVPDAVILESRLPDGDAFALCEHMRLNLGLTALPVVIIVPAALSHLMRSAIASSGCDEVLSLPLHRGQLYHVLAARLGLPTRCHHRVRVQAPLAIRSASYELEGEAWDLSANGARIRLTQPFVGESSIQVRMDLGAGRELVQEASVVWHKPHLKGAELGIEFVGVTEEAARLINALVTWRLEQRETLQWVTFHRNLTDQASFEGLAQQLGDRVVFDLRHVRLINSIGLAIWIRFLREIPDHVAYRFAHCSVAFCTQASCAPTVLGRGSVDSFFAPYICPACDQEIEKELEADPFTGVEAPEPPRFTCAGCGVDLLFDDLPERYFLFLSNR